ncbi:mycothione reductase [Mycobacterium yunnanensis]|uniref:Mycothione reductase n=1 Tax=Mycobacterium yunnanensis TaxID=368477 RepID=A0A9X2YYR2_9MYCO|nr:mycothione reductase [Mycobacterium yunnanensis]MCV7420554.1 mycothione reductase [Mycobacterium yunnanensis]
MTHFDLAVIGAGSGNSVITDEMAEWSIALVEQRRAGGTCLNYGCIPSKMLAFTAEVVDAVDAAQQFDVDATLEGLRWRDVRDRVFSRTDAASDDGRTGRQESENITYYDGHATFTGPRRFTVTDAEGKVEEVTADRVVVAAGGRPTVPAAVVKSGLPYETSDTIMRIDAVPRRLAVLGGGYIAAELAHVFAAAGSQITIVDAADMLLGGPQDDDVRSTFTTLMRGRHDLRLGTELSSLRGSAGDLQLLLTDGSTVEADVLLVAVGRTPNGDRLNLASAGVDVDDDGHIVVDRSCRTSADGVFALGDVSEGVPLKHVANREAEVVSHNLLHPERLRTIGDAEVPSAVFASPQMASVGRTERECRDRKDEYRVGRAAYSEVAYGWAMQDDDGFCKVLVDATTGLILGAHVIGPQAATLIQVFVVAIEFGIPAADLAHRPYWAHPALTEVIENALLDAPSVT